MTNVLFVCEGNVHRGPTAENLFANVDGINARSAGLVSSARVQVTEEMLEETDYVFVMEERLMKSLRFRFWKNIENCELVCLDIPDEFQRDQPELIQILKDQLQPYLGNVVNEI